MFHNNWHLAAFLDGLEQPGAFVSGMMAGTPALVVRGADGRLRAFHNVRVLCVQYTIYPSLMR